MGALLKKDMRLLIRDRKELIVLILMPFVLIAILGFALGGMFVQSSANFNMTVHLVSNDEAEKGYAKFVSEVETLSLPTEVQQAIIQAASQLHPHLLLESLFVSEEMQTLVELKETKETEARTAIEQGEADALIILPEGFTYNTLSKMFLDKGDGAVIVMEGSELSGLRASVLKDILDSFARTVNFHTALSQITGADTMQLERDAVTGGVEAVEQYELVNAQQYYTFGMAVMFVLFVASSMSSRAFTEKQQHTYDRLLIAGTHPLKFLTSKAVSTAIVAFLQTVLLLILSTLIFRTFINQDLLFWRNILLISTVLALCIGSLSALLTAFSHRLHTPTIVDVFSGMIIALLAFLGGSFFPAAQMSPLLQNLGEWTPNGAALTSLLQIAQGAEMSRWLHVVYRLIVVSGILLVVGMLVFPKRRVG